MKMLKMCLNWKVIAGLAALGVGTYVVAPNLAAAALPLLLLAICPLSMVLMMWGMQRGGGAEGRAPREVNEADAGLTREEHLARLRTEQADLAGRIGELERDEPRAGDRERRGAHGAADRTADHTADAEGGIR
ncbi:DUF2933 domain-containing protein [Rubrobacter tropicus]|uniref:DUF2933 domain-containing protein n=1 Tax=Rubrobacter tropicus TaxID=2653851 RepID=UPI001A9DB73E|nr:DUF2933 domain-containing protein [Rubrobacter tropicus]